DRTIVNPRNLAPRLRDDVCYQCHLSGDARIQRPGKNLLDFRPGTPLDDVVSIFLVPPTVKVGGFQALSQPEQIRLSRCRQADGSQLNCITCHDPHLPLSGVEAATYFDKQCMQCHAPLSQRFVQTHRAEKSPPGSCVACHMPKVAVTNIAHTALTNHRIPRSPADAESLPAGFDLDPQTNLIWATRPADGRGLDLRTLALTFAQLAPNYRGYGERGFPLLERAAREFPNDPEVQATYGQVLLVISPSYRARARQAFERAIAAGSKSSTLRRRLAQLLIEEGDAAATGLLREAIQLEPYNSATYLQLARAYLAIGNRTEAARTLEQALSFDPGNADARKLLNEMPP
ncbi:MAG TPA: tetratricopeptide repeat protein, partial [Blastocatellia bacterium]